MRVSVYDPVAKAYREVDLDKEEAEKFIASAKEVEKRLFYSPNKFKGGKTK